MSAEADYLHAERENLLQTLHLITDLLKKPVRSPYETIALGKLLQDLYDIARAATGVCHDFLLRLSDT